MKKHIILLIITSLIHTQLLASNLAVKSSAVEDKSQLEDDLNYLVTAAQIVQANQDKQLKAAWVTTKIRDILNLGFKKGVGNFLDPVVGLIQDLANGKVEDSNKRFQTALNSYLYQASLKDEKRFDTIFKIKDDTKRAQELFKALDDLDSFSSIAPKNTKERTIINSRAIVTIIKVLKQYGSEIESLKSQLKKDNAVYSKDKDVIDQYIKKSSRSIASYYEKTEELSNATEKIVGKVEKKVDEIEKNQTTGNVTPTPQYNFMEDFTAIIEKSQNVVDSSKALLTIADNFGLIDSERYEKVAKAINQAQTTITGVSQIAVGVSSSNPVAILQGVATLSGLFGKPKPDANAQRHKQVMEGLQSVQKSISGLYRGQERLYALQLQTVELMGTYYQLTAEKLDTNFEILHESMAGLQDTTRLLSQMNERLKSCTKFLNSRLVCDARKLTGEQQLKECIQKNNEESTGFVAAPFNSFSKLLSGDFVTHEERIKHFEHKVNKKLYAQCENALIELFDTTTEEFSPLFNARTHSGKDEKRFRALNYGIYQPLWNILKNDYLHNNQNHILATLSSPTSRLSSVPTKYSTLIKEYNKRPKDFIQIDEETFSVRMKNLLDVAAIEKYVYTLLEVIPYFDITEESTYSSAARYFTGDEEVQNIYSTEEVASDSLKMKESTLYSLDTALAIINTAIAQQALISGDLILPALHQKLFSRSTPSIFSDDDRKAKLKELSSFSKNRILVKNLFNYEMQRNLKYKRMLKDPTMMGGSGYGLFGTIMSAENQINRNLSYPENYSFNMKEYKGISENMYSRDKKKVVKAYEALIFISESLPLSLQPPELPGNFTGLPPQKKTILTDLGLKFPKPAEIEEDKIYYPFEMYRLIHLRQKLLETILSFKNGTDEIINQTLTIY